MWLATDGPVQAGADAFSMQQQTQRSATRADARIDSRTAGPLRCVTCGDVIGVYEPLFVLTAAGCFSTSIAAQPEIPAAGWPCHHLACWERVRSDG
jgi:hypothetical protein